MALAAGHAGLFAGCEGASQDRPNVVLITIDTIRADHLGCYGYGRARTPNIDAFAAAAVLFDQASPTINTTLASHASLLTGFYPQTLALPRNSFPLEAEFETLAGILSGRGYETAAFVSASALHSRMGLARGFHLYEETFEIQGLDQDQRRAQETTRAVMEWLGARHRNPFFLWVHYFDPHYPYDPPAPYDTLYGSGYEGPADGSMEYLSGIWERSARKIEPEQEDLQRVVDLYDGEIAYLDFWLGPLLERLGRPEHLERTLVAIAGDHGESLTEHDYLFNHGLKLYEPTLRVPLILRLPGTMGAEARTVPAQVQVHDLFPTILAASGAPVPPRVEAVDLTPLALGRTDSARPFVYAEASRPWQVERTHPGSYQNLHKAAAVQSYPWKLIVTPFENRTELYDLERDPGELVDLSLQDPARVAELKRVLDAWRRGAVRVAGRPDPENLERLRSLGYTR